MELETLDKLLKQVYLEVVIKGINDRKDEFIKTIEQTPRYTYGKCVSFYCEDEDCMCNLDIVNAGFTINITKKELELDNEKFIRLLNKRLEERVEELSNKLNSDFYGMTDFFNLFNLAKLSNGTFLYNVFRQTHPQLNPLTKTINKVKKEELLNIIQNHNTELNTIICSPKTYGEYSDELPENYRIVITDKVDNNIYILNSDDWKIGELCDWKWLPYEDGKVVREDYKYSKFKNGVSFTLIKYFNYICLQPNKQIKLMLKEEE